MSAAVPEVALGAAAAATDAVTLSAPGVGETGDASSVASAGDAFSAPVSTVVPAQQPSASEAPLGRALETAEPAVPSSYQAGLLSLPAQPSGAASDNASVGPLFVTPLPHGSDSTLAAPKPQSLKFGASASVFAPGLADALQPIAPVGLIASGVFDRPTGVSDGSKGSAGFGSSGGALISAVAPPAPMSLMSLDSMSNITAADTIAAPVIVASAAKPTGSASVVAPPTMESKVVAPAIPALLPSQVVIEPAVISEGKAMGSSAGGRVLDYRKLVSTVGVGAKPRAPSAERKAATSGKLQPSPTTSALRAFARTLAVGGGGNTAPVAVTSNASQFKLDTPAATVAEAELREAMEVVMALITGSGDLVRYVVISSG